MNTPVLIAGILCLLAFFAHAFLGDKELKSLKPTSDSEEKNKETWIQTHCGWHWVSIDLLLSGALLISLATSNLFQAKREILLLVSIYYFITGITWLATVIVSRNNNKQFLILGQWIFCFIIGMLIYYGNLNNV